MKFESFTKMVEVKFIRIDGYEFEKGLLYETIEMLDNQTKADDSYGDYSVREYEIPDYETMKNLVALGIVKNYTGPRMAKCYCIKDNETFKEFKEKIYALD